MRASRVLARLVVASAFPLAVSACTGPTSTTAEPSPTQAFPHASVDPLVPYSPSPTPFTERTSGFIPDTLTLPTSDGGELHLTPVTTTMTLTEVDATRAFVVYLDVEDPGHAAPWSGVVGTDAEVTDASGGVFPAEAPRNGDLHPDAKRYGGSNHDLLEPVTVRAGGTVSGALVFHVTGGNRPVTLRISLDGGATWGEWATNLGTF
jgi:hypothetical protein